MVASEDAKGKRPQGHQDEVQEEGRQAEEASRQTELLMLDPLVISLLSFGGYLVGFGAYQWLSEKWRNRKH